MENYKMYGNYAWMKKPTLEPEMSMAEMLIVGISFIVSLLFSILILNSVLLGLFGRIIVPIVIIAIITGTTEAIIIKVRNFFHLDKKHAYLENLIFAVRKDDKIAYLDLAQFLKEQLEKEGYKFEISQDNSMILACKNQQWYHIWYNQDFSFTIEWMEKDENIKQQHQLDMLRDKGQLAYWIQRVHGEIQDGAELFCEKCGNPVDMGAGFCAKCGNEIANKKVGNDAGKKKGAKEIVRIILLVIIAICGLVLLVTIIRGKNGNNLIALTKEAEFNGYPGAKIGRTLEHFCKSPEWTYESKDGEDYVIFTGKCQLFEDAKYTKIKICFEIIDIKDDTINYQVDYIKLDGEKLDDTEAYCVIDIIFGDGSNAAALMLVDWLYN